MGFLDNVQQKFSQVQEKTVAATSTMRLRAQMDAALKRRQQLVAQLGASLYEVTREDSALRAGREALYDGIAACDQERQDCQAQIDQIEAESAAAQAALVTFSCPFCGSRVAATDLFCAGCGRSAEEIKAALGPSEPAAPGTITCTECGAVAHEGDLFCMSCGHRFGSASAETQPASPTTNDGHPAE